MEHGATNPTVIYQQTVAPRGPDAFSQSISPFNLFYLFKMLKTPWRWCSEFLASMDKKKSISIQHIVIQLVWEMFSLPLGSGYK